MRTIFREQAYEKPLVAGRYQYRRDGQPTGSYESWRLTAARSGHYFLRVDLNADAGEGGDSTIYHLLLNPAWKPERLSFRHFRRGGSVAGNVLFEGETVILAVTAAGEGTAEKVCIPEPYAFWFPATTGLGLLAARTATGEQRAATLIKAEGFSLRRTAVNLSERPAEAVTAMGRLWSTRPVVVRWGTAPAAEKRLLWLDESGWPVRMARPDGLVALETRRLRYRPLEE